MPSRSINDLVQSKLFISLCIGLCIVVAAGVAINVVPDRQGSAIVPANVHDCNVTPVAGTTSAPATEIRAWPGWKPALVDDFNRCVLGPNWSSYSGKPGGNPNSEWSPSMVSVSGGMLHLSAQQQNGKWFTGGVANIGNAQSYGRWDVRFRIPASDEISFHMLLWPKDNVWPPEIDFLESTDGTRRSASSALHYRNADGSQGKIMKSVLGDFTNWNIATVEWGPGAIRLSLNGKPWQVIQDKRVPSVPMWLAMQIESGACQRNKEWGLSPCPRAGTPHELAMDVDWVTVYKPSWT
ncbi:glycoside hydrolase family 16 protein [Gordonia otitidis]|nr:glycoside hydrolase family 16 protein [Gordonia otitidis]